MSAIFYISYVALWLLMLVEGVLLLLVYRHFGLAALGTAEGVQRDGLAIGEKAQDITGLNTDGQMTLWKPGQGHNYFLAFVSPECGPCARVLPYINQVAANSSDLEVILITSGPKERLDQLIEKFHPISSILCLTDDGSGTSQHYRVRVTPFAFVVGENGQILAKGLCDQAKRLQDLLAAGGQKSPDFLDIVTSSSALRA